MNMKKVTENTKVTLTLKQLKELVKENAKKRRVKESYHPGEDEALDAEVKDCVRTALRITDWNQAIEDLMDEFGFTEDEAKDAVDYFGSPAQYPDDDEDEVEVW